MLASAGAVPDRCGTLLRRRRILGDREAWFFINLGAERVTETVDVAGYRKVTDLLGDCLIDQTGDELTIGVDGANLACLLLSS